MGTAAKDLVLFVTDDVELAEGLQKELDDTPDKSLEVRVMRSFEEMAAWADSNPPFVIVDFDKDHDYAIALWDGVCRRSLHCSGIALYSTQTTPEQTNQAAAMKKPVTALQLAQQMAELDPLYFI